MKMLLRYYATYAVSLSARLRRCYYHFVFRLRHYFHLHLYAYRIERFLFDYATA